MLVARPGKVHLTTVAENQRAPARCRHDLPDDDHIGSCHCLHVLDRSRRLRLGNAHDQLELLAAPEREPLRGARECAGQLLGGLVDRDGGLVQPNADAALVGDGYVLAVARSRRRLYLGTFGAGLRSWVPDQDAWGGVSLAEGLPSSDVASIAVGDGTVWIGVLGGGIIGIDEGIYGD